jgi:hypothetical protein
MSTSGGFMRHLIILFMLIFSTTAFATNMYDDLFQTYADCFGLEWKVLKGIANAESGLNGNECKGKYQGLFQESQAYCKGGIKPFSSILSCENRCEPEVNTAAAATHISKSLHCIKRSCGNISLENMILLTYVGHNNGPAVLAHLLRNKACDQTSMQTYIRSFYAKFPGGHLNGVDGDYGVRKWKHGFRVVRSVQQYGATRAFAPKQNLCPINLYTKKANKVVKKIVPTKPVSKVIPKVVDNDKETIIVIGDSHTTQTFGKTLDKLLRDREDFNIVTRGNAGSRPIHYVRSTSLKYGSLTIGKDGRAITKRGKQIVPKLNYLVRKHKPGIVVFALGENMMPLYLRNASEKKQRSVLKLIKHSVSKLMRNLPNEIGCIWIGPPQSSKKYEKPEQWIETLKEATEDQGCTFIDSRRFTKFPAGKNGYHYTSKKGKVVANDWANSVYSSLEDLL